MMARLQSLAHSDALMDADGVNLCMLDFTRVAGTVAAKQEARERWCVLNTTAASSSHEV